MNILQQFCEFYPEYEKCKQWLEQHLPNEFGKLQMANRDGTAGSAEDDRKRQKRGGKGILKVKKKDDSPKPVCISRTTRGKKKFVTVVTGLKSYSMFLFYNHIDNF